MRIGTLNAIALSIAVVIAAGCRGAAERGETGRDAAAAAVDESRPLALAGKVGVFCHFLPDAATFGRLDEFDVKGLVADLKRMRPDYFVLTLGQNSGYYCSPNATLERIAGYAPNARCSRRDIPREIIEGLRGSGIRFGLYLPNQPANQDAKMEDAFGFSSDVDAGGGAADRKFTSVGSDNWAKAIEEWSVRYGSDVALWWFDGGYQWLGFSDEHAAKYRRAVRKGNPAALVSFNPGVGFPATEKQSDYWAGEERECLTKLPVYGGVNAEGRPWQVLTFMGHEWGEPDCRFDDEQLRIWLAEATRRGGAVSLDVHIDCPGGRIPANQIEQFRRVRPRPPAVAPAAGRPELVVGVVSDVHVPQAGPEHLRKALELFDRDRVDAVLVCGDMTHYGMVRELKEFHRRWNEVFPGDRRSDGVPVVPLFIYGDHDTGGYMQDFDDGVPPCTMHGVDFATVKSELIPVVGSGVAWKNEFGEEWDYVQVKDVKGYRFILSHYYGGIHQETPPFLAEKFNAAVEGLDAKRPFFFVQHRVIPDTVQAHPCNVEWWCADNAAGRELLVKHPNAIGLCGHSHSNLFDEKNLWRGEFTAVEVPALKELAYPKALGFKRGDNDETSAQCLIMKVWPRRVVFERYDALYGRRIADDWVVDMP